MPRSRHLLTSSWCASVALVAGGVAFAAAPATAEPAPSFDQCAEAFPADELVDGQVVTGLTTAGRSRGSATAPEAFSGRYIDTLESDEGDVLVFDLSGSRITEGEGGDGPAGVWSGMSGSPLYAEDGRLVGAVAMTFGSDTASTIAGVTPAADLYDLIDDEQVPAPERITLSSKQKKQLVAAGASSSELGSGARRIAPVSAITLDGRFAKGYAAIAKRAGAPHRDVATGGSASAEDIAITAGGNLAVADSYGSLSSFALGTATAVCGSNVVGFGHPLDFANAQRTIHGARTSLIQSDGAYSYKLGSLAAPQGALLHDGLAGVLGRIGQDVDSTVVTSKAAANGKAAKTYGSTVPNPDALAEIAATHAFRDAALAQDQVAGGESVVSWTVKGTSVEDGKPVTLTRTQRYSALSSLAQRLGDDLGSDIAALQENEFANVDIDDVTIDDTLSASYKALKVGKVERYDSATRTWKKLSTSKAVPAVRGKVMKLRVSLVKADKYSKATPRTFETSLHVSRHAFGVGRLKVAGGQASNWFDDDEEFYEDSAPWDENEYYFEDDEGEDSLTIPEKKPTTAQGVADLLSKQARHDAVYVSHDYRTASVGLVNNDRRARTDSVVKGSMTFRVTYR